MSPDTFPVLFWLLLPIAAASGWWAASRSHRRPDSNSGLLPRAYFKGLNYLLNEQPDKAIETFIQVLEVDGDTVETHLALGNLFRRRGEVDRAIRIHQNLIARPTLNQQQRYNALLELGLDYMSAGLLDRAESLFTELVESEQYVQQSLIQLVDVYQLEKDWDKAIECCRRLRLISGQNVQVAIAHYQCEKAEEAMSDGQGKVARELLKKALKSDPLCARASILEARIAYNTEKYKIAIGSLKRVENQDPELLTEIVEPMAACYSAIGQEQDYAHYLDGLAQQYGGIQIVLKRTELEQQQQGIAAASRYLATALQQYPSLRGLSKLAELSLEENKNIRGSLTAVRDVMAGLCETRPEYVCSHCGFTGKALHWLCPGCQHWNTIKAIQGVEGE